MMTDPLRAVSPERAGASESRCEVVDRDGRFDRKLPSELTQEQRRRAFWHSMPEHLTYLSLEEAPLDPRQSCSFRT